jgi:hypothetical protein
VVRAPGRLIGPDDDRTRGDGFVAVLSYDYWRNRFGADPNIVGQRITINGNPLTIIGVSQAGFDGLDIGAVSHVRFPLMLKAQMTPNWDDVDNRRSRWVNVFGRLKPGVRQDQALAAMQPFFHGLLEQEVLMSAFSGTTPYTREQFLKGGTGYGDFKKQLFEKLWEYFAPMRKRREEILADKLYIDDVLKKGATRANKIAEQVMKRVREAVGLR